MCSECTALQREPAGIPLHSALAAIIDHPARAPQGRHGVQMTAYRCTRCETVWARELRTDANEVRWHLMSRRVD
jgi:hypothetical protein